VGERPVHDAHAIETGGEVMVEGMAGDVSTPITGRPVATAIGTATRPLPMASSTIGPSASPASST
jgi:hypothetical protein